MTEKFPNLENETDIQIQEAQRVLNMMNPKWSTSTHVIIEIAKVKDKENILKAARKNKWHTRKPPIFQQKLYKPKERGRIYLKC